MATVSIQNLKVSALIGTKPAEQRRRQTIFLNISFLYNSAQAQQTDDLAHAVDYEALAQEIRRSVAKTRFALLERLGGHILGIVLENRRIREATVTIRKRRAISMADSVTLILHKKR